MVGYEAGPAGFSLYRFLTELNVQCAVIAPGSLVRRPADRVKTDRRDARMIAHGLRNGDVDRVAIPTPENEATRDFLRARDDLREELKHYKQRLNQLLLRHGLQYTDGSKWTRGHRQWIQNLEFAVDRLKQTAELYYYRIVELEEKILQMDQEIQQIAQSEPYAEPVDGSAASAASIGWSMSAGAVNPSSSSPTPIAPLAGSPRSSFVWCSAASAAKSPLPRSLVSWPDSSGAPW